MAEHGDLSAPLLTLEQRLPEPPGRRLTYRTARWRTRQRRRRTGARWGPGCGRSWLRSSPSSWPAGSCRWRRGRSPGGSCSATCARVRSGLAGDGIGADGVERRIPFGSFAAGHRGELGVLKGFDGLSPAARRDVCRAWAAETARVGTEVGGDPGLRHHRLVPLSGPGTPRPPPRVPGAVNPVRAVERFLFAPGSARRLLLTQATLAAVIGIRIAAGPTSTWPGNRRRCSARSRSSRCSTACPVLRSSSGCRWWGRSSRACAVAGWRRQATFPMAWLCLLVLAGLRSGRGKFLHNDALLLLAAVPFLLAPVVRWRDRAARAAVSGRFGWPVRTALVVVAGAYFFSGLAKLTQSGAAWVITDNMRFVLYEAAGGGRVAFPGIPTWLAGQAWMAHALAAFRAPSRADVPGRAPRSATAPTRRDTGWRGVRRGGGGLPRRDVARPGARLLGVGRGGGGGAGGLVPPSGADVPLQSGVTCRDPVGPGTRRVRQTSYQGSCGLRDCCRRKPRTGRATTQGLAIRRCCRVPSVQFVYCFSICAVVFFAHNDRGEAPGGASSVSRYVPTRIFLSFPASNKVEVLPDRLHTGDRAHVREFTGFQPRSSQLPPRVGDVCRRDWRGRAARVRAGAEARAEAGRRRERRRRNRRIRSATARRRTSKKLVDAEGREYRVCPQCAYNMYKQGRMWVCENCGYSYVE